MGIRFVLMVNKQGQTRLAQYYEYLNLEERRALEGEIVRKCLARNEQQCSFVEHRNYKVIYRRYASLFFLVGVDNEEVSYILSTMILELHLLHLFYNYYTFLCLQNELAILEFIHLLVETMDRHFGNVCELDIMFHLEKAHFMLEEMVMNGCIVETSKSNILSPIQLMEKAS
ncbi:AP-4 complex subunit sigma [Striga hermonthica]|uniref:AP complex subunit sigma n=1 Tax=Striga hermonthica TaxID=68872 RepID=A0A9N7NP92_STRHE|nr:AP-4 complex subunit sigma [Striga hermonthica]